MFHPVVGSGPRHDSGCRSMTRYLVKTIGYCPQPMVTEGAEPSPAIGLYWKPTLQGRTCPGMEDPGGPLQEREIGGMETS